MTTRGHSGISGVNSGANKDIGKKSRAKYHENNGRAGGGGAGERAGDGSVGADKTGRDRGRGGSRRRLRPDGAHDAGRYSEEQSDEAADGGLAQGRSLRRRSADVHEIKRSRSQQGADRLFADLHAAAVGEDPVQLARADPGVGGGAGPVRARGQCFGASDSEGAP